MIKNREKPRNEFSEDEQELADIREELREADRARGTEGETTK